MYNSKFLFYVVGMTMLALLVTGCGVDNDPKQCGANIESQGRAVAKKSIIRFLRYAGKAHAPIGGEGGTLDATKLGQISDGDLVYDGRSSSDNQTYQFHLRWAPNAVFVGSVAANCSVETNWSIK